MIPRRHRIFTLLALLLLAVPPVFAFAGEGVPRTNDLLPHLYRAAAFREAVEWTNWWPRWSPHLVHGYGYPVFNFFPSTTHALIALFGTLLPLTAAYTAVVYLHTAVAAVSSFALGRTIGHSDAAGWAAAVAYTYSPYLLYDAVVRGSPPESQALALLPLLVLGVWHLTRPQPPIHWVPITAGTYALMILSHHPVTLQISYLLGVWLLWRGLRRRSFTVMAPAVVALALGGLLTAFFSLPALLEIDATRAQLSISQGYTYRDNFLPFPALFQRPVTPADPARLNPPVVRSLPVVALAAVLLCLPVAWPRLPRARRHSVLVWIGLLGLSIFLITPTADWVWATVPLLQFTLYPWRLLGWASLAAAVLAAYLVPAVVVAFPGGWLRKWPRLFRVPPQRMAGLPLFAFTAAVSIAAVPWLYPPREPAPPDPRIPQVAAFEQPPFFIGTTTLGEFLPRQVDQLPDTADLKTQLTADPDHNPDRLQSHPHAAWTRTGTNPVDAAYTITATQAVTLTYRQFDFPGWRATLNGDRLPITAAPDTGLITVAVPAGTHTLTVRFGRTPIRTTGTAVSVAALLALAAVTVVGRRRLSTDETASAPPAPAPLLTLVLVPLWMLIFFTLIDTPLRRPTLQPGQGVVGTPAVPARDYGGELWLLSYEPDRQQTTADAPIPITLYWQAQKRLGVDYVAGVQIVDAAGTRWDNGRPQRPIDWRFVAGGEVWPPDAYRLDPFELHLLPGTPPGEYRVLVGAVRVHDAVTIDAHETAAVTVTAPDRTPADAFDPEPGLITMQTEPVAGLSLTGLKPDRENARPGDPVRVDVLWRVAVDAPPTDAFRLALRPADGGESVFAVENQPLASAYPAADWTAGDRLRAAVVTRLPADLPGGRYAWTVAWGDHIQPIDDALLTVDAPERSYEPPQTDIDLGIPLGGTAELVGATAVAAGSAPLEIMLVWRATTPTDTAYRVFVHLRDADGRIVAQSDGEPAQWQRPTTGWLPPEIVIDGHTLAPPPDLPPGPYTLIAGVYDPATGRRLTTADGGDHISITPLQNGANGWEVRP